MSEAGLYPVALDVRGKRCVVVGSGSVGTRKIVALISAGADVVVVAPDIAPEVATLVAHDALPHYAEPFSPWHLDGAFLAIAAVNKPEVNQAVADAARARNVLLNLAAPALDEQNGDFATMATIRRGDLLIALSTGGAGPALSAHLKRELESRFGPEWIGYVALLGEMRSVAKQQITQEGERAQALRRLVANDRVMRWIASGDPERAREEALSCLFP